MYESKFLEFPWIPGILFSSLNQRHTYLMIIFQEWPLKVTFFSFEAMTVMTTLGDSVIQNTNAKAALTLHTGTLRYSFYMLIFYFLVILVFIFFIILHHFKRLSSKWKSKAKTIISKSVTRRSLCTPRMRNTTLSNLIITKTLGWYYFLPFYRWDWGSEKLNNLL